MRVLALLALLVGLGAGRRLQGIADMLANRAGVTTHSIIWSVAQVPYPPLAARCGDHLTFRWEPTGPGAQEQAVALVTASTPAKALAKCKKGALLAEQALAGEYTEVLSEEGTFYFAEPSNCGRGQILTVTVDCSPEPKAKEKKEKEEEAAAEEEAPAAALMVGDSSDASAVAAAEAPTDTHTWAHEAAAAAPAPATHDGETPVVAMGSIDPLDKDAA